ncbi:protein unc-93 homolog A-like [Macrobrachium rosenbergii]|uniref:protein unc-93 homolog A-like n=1 Tax=Macrobrachium rosenbergii TaxID=79674 RepID=UPI0034D5E9A0
MTYQVPHYFLLPFGRALSETTTASSPSDHSQAQAEGKRMESINVTEDNTDCRQTQDASPENKKKMSSIMKNVISLAVAMTFLFTSYFSMENLQSSIHKIDGTTSLAAIYISFIISSCFISTLLIRTFGEKSILFACSVYYVAYMTAQLYPKPYVLLPTAVLLGTAAGPLWAAQGSYITKVGTAFANLSGEDTSDVITRFFGVFFMFFQSTQIWGNLITSSVLSIGAHTPVNEDEDSLSTCGYRFCIAGGDGTKEEHLGNDTTETSEEEGIPKWQIHALTAFFLTGAFASSAIILLLLDQVHKYYYSEEDGRKNKSNVLQSLYATLNHVRHPYQLLLIPLTVWSGIERAFLSADFTAAYVSCGLGVHMVGYTMICYGACDVIGSMIASYLVRCVGRAPVITLAFFINVSVIATLIVWLPRSDHLTWYFVVAGLWGFADAVWMTQLNSIYGVMFPKQTEPAFSNCRLWEATGFALSFGLSSILCINVKIIVILVFLALGVFGYFFIEFLEKMGGLPKDGDGTVVPIDKLNIRNR